jgi:hypothetical protein
MSLLEYKNELTNLKRQYLNFLYLVDDFQKEKILIEVSKIEAKIKFIDQLKIDNLFDRVNLDFYYAESKL